MIRRRMLVWTLVGIGAFLFVDTCSARERLFQRLPRRQKAVVADKAPAACEAVQGTDKAPQVTMTKAEKAQLDELLKAGKANGQSEAELKAIQEWWTGETAAERAKYFKANAPQEAPKVAEQTAAEKAQLDELLKTGKANGQSEADLKAIQEWWAGASAKDRADYFKANK